MGELACSEKAQKGGLKLLEVGVATQSNGKIIVNGTLWATTNTMKVDLQVFGPAVYFVAVEVSSTNTSGYRNDAGSMVSISAAGATRSYDWNNRVVFTQIINVKKTASGYDLFDYGAGHFIIATVRYLEFDWLPQGGAIHVYR